MWGLRNKHKVPYSVACVVPKVYTHLFITPKTMVCGTQNVLKMLFLIVLCATDRGFRRRNCKCTHNYFCKIIYYFCS